MKSIASSLVLLVLCGAAAPLGAQEARTGQLSCETDFEPAPHGHDFVDRGRRDYDIPEGARVGNIHITRLPIFDETNPREDNLLFRWANRFHIMTWERVIDQQLLFEEGQEYRQRLMQETGRLLRGQGYFFDVDVRPVSKCGDRVDVEVITRDTWSFMPSIGFDRSGGDNSYSVGLRDSNILGSGKLLAFSRRRDTDRSSSELFYDDNNLFGSRVRTSLKLVESDDGFSQSFNLGLPFFALDSTRAWDIRVRNEERVDEQFFRGDEITEVEHRIEDVRLQIGVSEGLRDGVVSRWNFGYQYRRDRFAQGDDLPPPVDFPRDMKLSYPFVAFESIENNYDTAINLDQIYRTEDLHLGHRFYNRVGYASTIFGANQDRLVVDGLFSDALIYNEDMLLRHRLEWEGKWNQDTERAEDVVVSYEARYFRRQTSHRSFFASVEAVYSKNLNTNEQVVLGGLTGARAFENRFQVGDRRVVLTLEERMYTDIHLFNLIRVGGAVFLDAGRAWDPGGDNVLDENGITGSGTEDDWLVAAGFGLRFASSKAASNRIAHLDFAFPLTNQDDPAVDSLMVAFNIKSAF